MLVSSLGLGTRAGFTRVPFLFGASRLEPVIASPDRSNSEQFQHEIQRAIKEALTGVLGILALFKAERGSRGKPRS